MSQGPFQTIQEVSYLSSLIIQKVLNSPMRNRQDFLDLSSQLQITITQGDDSRSPLLSPPTLADSSDDYNPEEDLSHARTPKKGRKKIAKADKAENPVKNSRKERNIFPNSKDKIYRKSLLDANLREQIEHGRLQEYCQIYFDEVKKKQTIRTKVSKKMCKVELFKFLCLLRLKFTVNERERIKNMFVELIDDSIALQEKKKSKNSTNAQCYDTAIQVYEFIKIMIDGILISASNTSEIRSRLFYAVQNKKYSYNAGVKKIQENKMAESLKEIEDLLFVEEWEDVLELGERTSIQDARSKNETSIRANQYKLI